MDAGAISRNLERRAEILAQHQSQAVRNYGVSGYNTEAFQPMSPEGAAPVRVNSAAEAAKLPSGTKFIDHNGQPRTRR
jgi:hypothetical protein